MTMNTAAMALGGYAVMPPRLGLAVYGSPKSLTIFRIVLKIRPGRYC